MNIRSHLLSLLVLVSVVNTAQASGIETLHYALGIMYYMQSGLGSVLNLKQHVDLMREMPTLAEVPAPVAQFCRQRIALRGLDPQGVGVKVKEWNMPLAAVGSYAILFSKAAAVELESALANDSDVSRKIIKIYTVLLDHEIKHLQRNDGVKRSGMFIGAQAATFLLGNLLIHSAVGKLIFVCPSSYKGLFITSIAYNSLVMAQNWISKKLYSRYSQAQETAADLYAFERAEDAEALRLVARYFENMEESLVQFLEDNALIPSPHLPFVIQQYLIFMRNLLHMEYQGAQTEESFRAWVMKKPEILAQIKRVYDPEHPCNILRAQIAKSYADKKELALSECIAQAA